jgi:hypothetical protein
MEQEIGLVEGPPLGGDRRQPRRARGHAHDADRMARPRTRWRRRDRPGVGGALTRDRRQSPSRRLTTAETRC